MSGLRRWGGYLALVVVFATACGLLSWWQWARRAEAVAEIERVTANYDAPPAELGDLLGGLDAWDVDDEWRPVVLTGEYLSDEQLLVRNRPYSGASGFEVLVPLLLENGRVFVVNRGWVPVGSSIDAPDAVPAAPSGEVTIVARLQAGEPELPGRSAPEGQLATIHLPSVAELLDEPVYTGAYGILASEDPAPAERPAPAAKPVPDEGPHLSYALQWIAFGILAFIGLFWAIRRERRIAALPESERAAARAPKRRHEDADYEDAVLDAERVE
ncbi:MAG: SURF1 family protein [Microbacteriaceae bacterium]|nr:SURF1 family protein [Microbacteriaceae bacterium]